MTQNYENKLIFIPYANIINAESGVNISAKSDGKDVYLKNCCVSLISAKRNNDCDVALVTNIDIPEYYKKILIDNNVLILKCEFDTFLFGLNYKWNLAFYKLCALYHVVREYDYNYYSYLDTDIFVQNSFDNIWCECRNNIMLYDICHGLQVEDYRIFLEEVRDFNSSLENITHFGGEFFASNRENALEFSNICFEIYQEMMSRDFLTTRGDEFILSIAAFDLKNKVKNAGAYIYRYWTGVSFRLVSTNYLYNPVVVLHIPREKEKGIIRIFDKYVKNNCFPSNKQAHRILKMQRQSFVDLSKKFLRGLIKR